ncbi:MAG: NAD(P)H-binding protein [Anaerolineaceae bacterium]|nr:NAD(P)H-binding protein [Anaerolineaceae bacterium]
MILVTGGTGFIGQVLVRQLVAAGHPVRILLRPSKTSPRLPKGIPVEAAVCSLKDERGLRAAMKGVEGVYHLAGAEQRGSQADLQGVDIEGSRMVSKVAAEAGVKRLVYLSHLGADRASAYPVLKAKGIAERLITQSGVAYSILRSALVFGPGDHFTTRLARLFKMTPFVFLMPGEGHSMLQPIWIEDLVMALTLSLDESVVENRTLSIGGPEFLSFREISEQVAQAAGVKKPLVPMSPAYLRILAVWMEHSMRNFPMSIFWQDYLAADRTCELDTLPRLFGLLPERFGRQLDYLWPAKKPLPSSGAV